MTPIHKTKLIITVIFFIGILTYPMFSVGLVIGVLLGGILMGFVLGDEQ